MKELIGKIYKTDNYKIIYTNAKTKNAIIFFSGNGIYYPDTADIFTETILNNDRYEWDNIAKNKTVQKHYRIIIFVRDVFKKWYTDGINEQLNTREKTIDFLASKIKGYNVTTCGNSAGGYMAVFAGIKLNADKIFSFSGQFDINDKVNTDNLKEHSLQRLLNLKSAQNTFYFYPANSPRDEEQYRLIKNSGLNIFKFDECEHGITAEGRCYPHLLTLNKKKLAKLAKFYTNKTIDKKSFSKKIIPFSERLSNFLRKICPNT